MNAERSEDRKEYHSGVAVQAAESEVKHKRRGRLKRLGDAIVPRLARWLISMLWKTCRIEVDTDAATLELLDSDAACIPCYWHGQQIFCLRALLDHRQQRPSWKLGYLISPSRDGDAAARVFADLDLYVIRGSASRGGAQALREIYQAIRRDGVSPVVTPDGPRGPHEAFKPGVVMLASLAAVPLVPVAFAATPAARLSSWDHTLLPLPFARVRVLIGAPLSVARGLDNDGVNASCATATATLKRLQAEAKASL